MSSTSGSTVSNYGDESAPFGVVETERTRVGFAQPTLDGIEAVVRIFGIADFARPTRADLATAIAALVAEGFATKEEIRD